MPSVSFCGLYLGRLGCVFMFTPCTSSGCEEGWGLGQAIRKDFSSVFGNKKDRICVRVESYRSRSSESTISHINFQKSDTQSHDAFMWGEVLPAMKCVYFIWVTGRNFKTWPHRL